MISLKVSNDGNDTNSYFALLSTGPSSISVFDFFCPKLNEAKSFPLGRRRKRSTPTKSFYSRADSEQTQLTNEVISRIEPGPYDEQVPSSPRQPWATAPLFGHQILNWHSFLLLSGKD